MTLQALGWRRTAFGFSLLLVLVLIAESAAGRVGVTSETDGDPLGRPPAQNERILRVGIDIQADELITTRDDDRAHLVFLDGTALTISPNSELKVDRFVYDPQSRTGEINITAAKGVFRLVGGRISKTTPIVVRTPSSTIGIRGGIGLFSIERAQTTARFLFGTYMSVTAGGQTQTAQRPGSEIRTALGGAPGVPTLIAPGALNATLQALEATQRRGGAAAGGGTGAADDQARRSGFSQENSGRPVIPPSAGNAQALSQAIDSKVLSLIPPSVAAAPVTQTVSPPSTTPTVPTTGNTGGLDCPPPQYHHHHHHHHGYNYRR